MNHFYDSLLNIDKRPKRKRWAPGNYSAKCLDCGKSFTGDKRATQCADCAYKDESQESESV